MSVCVCVCALPGKFVLSQSFVNLHSKWFSPPWWLIEWGKRLSRHPWSLWAPQRRRSSLCGSELREQILCLLFLLFISLYSWLWAHFIPIYFCGLFRYGRSLVGYFRTYWLTFDSNTFFRFQFLYSCRNFLHKCRNFLHKCRKFRSSKTRVESYDRLIRCKELLRFFRFAYSPYPTLGLTKILSIGIRA